MEIGIDQIQDAMKQPGLSTLNLIQSLRDSIEDGEALKVVQESENMPPLPLLIINNVEDFDKWKEGGFKASWKP